MNKNEYQRMWLEALKDGTFVTLKHDPNSVGTTSARHRTVLSHEMLAGLEHLIASGEFNIHQYDNVDYLHSPLYVEVEPTSPRFSVPGSGIPASRPTPTSACDRLVVVSGQQQGWHIYAESKSEIARRVASGQLICQSGP